MTEQSPCPFCGSTLAPGACCVAGQILKERDEARAQVEKLERMRNFDTGAIPLPKGLMLEYTRLDDMWQELVRERDEARRDLAGARHEVAMLQTCGAILLRTIYESGIAYDNPEVELALAAFAESAPAG